jgi:hypothetical protein
MLTRTLDPGLQVGDDALEILSGEGFLIERQRAQLSRSLAIVFNRDDDRGDMPGIGGVFEAIEYRPAAILR